VGFVDNKKSNEIERLKKECLSIEQRLEDEKRCLSNVIHTLGRVMVMHEGLSGEYNALNGLIDPAGELAVDKIESQVEILKNKIFTQETKKVFDEQNTLEELNERLLRLCRIIKRIVVTLVDDFYPTTDELKARADLIDIDCGKENVQMDLEGASNEFLSYIRLLKNKISEDFRYINNTFLTLLNHVKELEKTLTAEFGQEVRLKDIERFETKVNTEVGSIADSFNIYDTIDEIKSAVVEKLTKIKTLFALRKKEETEKAKKTRENIDKLKKKILETEKDARHMAKKVAYFQKAATKDGLTGLFNRSAFDIRISDALKMSNQQGEPVSLILFDVDNFKWINDTLGHVAGDKVLKIMAGCLRNAFRKNDFIARYGGDEFAVVVEKLDPDIAKRKIVNFREDLKQKRFFSHQVGDVDVTVSAGVAFSNPGDSAEDLIQRADENMYRSKQKKS
jgi:diguanylate cyclase (GGDEF)-like protein